MKLFEKIKQMNIEEMADYLGPLFDECYGCIDKDCNNCTETKQKNNIINILNSEED